MIGREVFDLGARDPVWWIRNVLGVELWAPGQTSIVESVRDNKRTAAASCQAIGKTTLGACITLWWLYTHVPSVVITTSRTNRQVVGQLWAQIRTRYRDARWPLGGAPPLVQDLKLADDHFAKGFTAPDYDPDRFQGWHFENQLIIVDESSEIPAPVFEGIHACMTGATTKLLLLGNPTTAGGDFFRAFAPNSNYWTTKISAFDTPNLAGLTLQDFATNAWRSKQIDPLPYPSLIDSEYVADRLIHWGGGSIENALQVPTFVSRILGRFPDQGEDTLYRLGWIEAAKSRALSRDRSDDRPVLGLDVARRGSDESVLISRVSGLARIVRAWRGKSTVETFEIARREAVALRARELKIDSIGIGAGVYDMLAADSVLRSIGCRVIEAVASHASTEPDRFANARAEWHWRLREDLEDGRLDIDPDDDLEGQLSAIRWMIRRGRIQIEEKDELVKRIGVSPDRLDALTLTYAIAKSAEIVVC